MAIADTAPILNGAGVTQAQVDNYFANLPAKPTPQPEPTITKAKIVAIADICYSATGISGAGGIKQMASTVDLSTAQVKDILKELQTLNAEWTAANPT